MSGNKLTPITIVNNNKAANKAEHAPQQLVKLKNCIIKLLNVLIRQSLC
ncbi:hypothetical protein ETSB_1185 [cyanobacterium endosymbiont of Epithemia turgida isolate EtSB Lake Yunoko]|nr:hypothetical protein ETSB_1185 [cyanobacterium endosymbiont of Epithemia turgida isolate EtSB Lake Yunoko]